MSYTITPAMTKAGYLTLQKIAAQHGYGWTFDMVSEWTVNDAMTQVFKAMVAAAPPSWPTRVKKAIKLRIKRFADKLEV